MHLALLHTPNDDVTESSGLLLHECQKISAFEKAAGKVMPLESSDMC